MTDSLIAIEELRKMVAEISLQSLPANVFVLTNEAVWRWYEKQERKDARRVRMARKKRRGWA